ncbi:hypothetical protein IVB22_11520 [Bradyrhizobium sp. 190]|nr:hypothetical protein [Bradyrhizobium sp. 190]
MQFEDRKRAGRSGLACYDIVVMIRVSAEVEAVIDEMPSVRETVVVRRPHADFGECVVAFVIPADTNRPPAVKTSFKGSRAALRTTRFPNR